MKQPAHSSEPKFRKFHASVLRKRWVSRAAQTRQEFLLCEKDFRFAAVCERMRVDRNHSVLSLLLVRLHKPLRQNIDFLARVLEGRLRVTDTPGLLNDGRIAILLPDTSQEGAWKVAEDISEVYPAGPDRPECEVLVYPGSDRVDTGQAQELDSTEDDPEDFPPEEQKEKVATSSPPRHATRTNEFFFVKPLPLWKRTLDILGGCVGLTASLPILLVAAVAVKATSRGPVFFRQQREGYGGKQFTIWKLRTMQVDAEARKQSLRPFSQQDGPAFKMFRDPRTTAVGRFLRWSSMDELPQFWNVIIGDMSLVGPRPLPIEESAACEDWQRRRLHVKPGMTCTWQVCERGKVSFDEWARMDLRYADNYGVTEDLRLLIFTLPSVLLQKGMR